MWGLLGRTIRGNCCPSGGSEMKRAIVPPRETCTTLEGLRGQVGVILHGAHHFDFSAS